MNSINLFSNDSVGLIFLSVGFVSSMAQILTIIKANSTKKWLETKAVIKNLKINSYTDINSGDLPLSTKMYRTELFYEYLVKGKTYLSNRVFWGDKIFVSSKNLSNSIYDRYQNTNNVQAYYNPNDISECVLEIGVNNICIKLLIAYLLLSLFGLIMILN